MKLIVRYILSLLMIISFSISLGAQGFLHAKDKAIVNEGGEKILLRGMGLGGWMVQEGYMMKVQKIGQQQHVIKGKIEELIGKEKTMKFYDAWLANHTRKIDIDSLASWGFNSVRLAMHYNLYTLPIEQEPVPGNDTWLEEGFALTDSLLKWCKTNKIYLILDLHAAPGGQGHDLNISDRDPSKLSLWESEANQKKTIALWRKLAERYANEPWVGAYDILNEPNWGFENVEDKKGCNEQKNEPLKKLMIAISAAIREVDKNHIIVIEGNCFGNNYNGILPPWDKNMVLSFHKYWSKNDLNSVKNIIALRDQYNIPVWLGESGENSNVWFTEAIELVERNEIGWAWWPNKKLGYSNPLEAKVPSAYRNILDYWADKGPKPSVDDAYNAVMDLAESLKLENCIYHREVVDAMFRQVYSNETLPFKTNNIAVTPTILAVDYDLGKIGFAYFDKDSITSHNSKSENHGGSYRNDGVDIETIRDSDTVKYYVSEFGTGEWLQYTVSAKNKGAYAIQLLVAAGKEAKIELEINQQSFNTKLLSPKSATGQWQTLKYNNIPLKRGKNIIRIKSHQGNLDFMSMQFTTSK